MGDTDKCCCMKGIDFSGFVSVCDRTFHYLCGTIGDDQKDSGMFVYLSGY